MSDDSEEFKYFEILLGHEVTCFKSIIVACTTFHFYYTVTHLDEEVEYIWSKKWTTGKIMYLLTRYLGALFLICSAIGDASAWNDSDLYKFVVEEVALGNFFPSCFGGRLYAGLGPMIILSAEVILQMRIYALYGRDKRLLAFFVLLTIALFGFNILQMSTLFLAVEQNLCGELGGCFNKRNIFRRAFISNDAVTTYGCLYALPMSGIAWSVTAFTEFLLFLLVIIRARKGRFKIRETATRQDILTGMAKDSIVYFAVMFTLCLIGTMIVFIPEHVYTDFADFLFFQMNSYETIAITIMTILAPKLMINIRAEFYGPPDANETQLTWNADALEFVSQSEDVSAVVSSDGGNGSPGVAEGSRSGQGQEC